MLKWLGLGRKNTARTRETGRSLDGASAAGGSSAISRPLPAVLAPTDFTDELLEEGRAILMTGIAGTVHETPLLTDTARTCYQLSTQPDISVAELARAVSQDLSLTAALFRKANSAHYRGVHPVMTVDGALNRVGFQGLRHILMVASAKKVLAVPGHPQVTHVLAARAAAVGYAAREVAAIVALNGDVCFAAGLLHDIGLPVAYQTAIRLRPRLPEPLRTTAGAIALAVQTHESVGAAVARQWNLAPATALAIAHHHSPLDKTGRATMAARVVAAAMAIVDWTGWYPEQTGRDVMDVPAVVRLALTPAQVERIGEVLTRELERPAAHRLWGKRRASLAREPARGPDGPTP